MKQVPDSLLAFQHMFPDDDACAAWLIEMRWPDGFVCPACGHEKGWALRRKAHTFECAGCRRQTSVTAGDPARQAAAHRLVLGRLPDGDPLQRMQRNSCIGTAPRPQAAAMVEEIRGPSTDRILGSSRLRWSRSPPTSAFPPDAIAKTDTSSPRATMSMSRPQRPQRMGARRSRRNSTVFRSSSPLALRGAQPPMIEPEPAVPEIAESSNGVGYRPRKRRSARVEWYRRWG